jgi:hypothetical protein
MEETESSLDKYKIVLWYWPIHYFEILLAQAVRRWMLDAEARVQSPVTHVKFVVNEMTVEQVYPWASWFFLADHNSTIAPSSSVTARWVVR